MLLGEWTIDVKKMLMVLTDEPDNDDHHRIVLRANTHKRQRGDNTRFSCSIIADSLKPRDLKSGGKYPDNWLGWTWYHELNNELFPTMA